jgi:hypothetical protein
MEILSAKEIPFLAGCIYDSDDSSFVAVKHLK